ncbi:MAG: methyltransferase, partial [Clostridia bacterium]|nr:methyltransferase [Clostridia bacterium]
WGAMTIMTLAKCPGVKMTMADVNERALALAVSNVAKNRMQAEAVLSDGFASIEGEFDAVITNPPIRAGKAVIYKMFEDAKAHLVPGGVLYLVIRKQQGAPSALKFLKALYAKAEVIERDGGYWIIACTA